MADDQRLEQLKQKYQSALTLIQQSGVRLSHVHVQDNKLFLQGEAPSDQVKNKVWDEIKRIDPSYSDLTCDLTVNPSLPQPAAQQAAQQTGASAAGGMARSNTSGSLMSLIATAVTFTPHGVTCCTN